MKYHSGDLCSDPLAGLAWSESKSLLLIHPVTSVTILPSGYEMKIYGTPLDRLASPGSSTSHRATLARVLAPLA